ncbi:serine protease 55-like [Latimeria chalumnae]|uniref:serine protease 55-like n=1 Tax=Latimeria chalumnae TaxID=7897 RepID=UPI00313B38C5
MMHVECITVAVEKEIKVSLKKKLVQYLSFSEVATLHPLETREGGLSLYITNKQTCFFVMICYFFFVAASHQCGMKGIGSFLRILGGKKAQDKEWPWQAYITINIKTEFACGGTIIGKRWILTAAHNLVDEGVVILPNQVSVYTGITNKKRLGTPQEVEQVLLHDKFDIEGPKERNFDYDVALLKLKEDLVLSSRAWPVCLPCTKEVSELITLPSASLNWTEKCEHHDKVLTGAGGTENATISGYITGWGVTRYSKKGSTYLQEGEIFVQNRNVCLTYEKPYFTDNMFCAKGDGVDSCGGDSGGPFVTELGTQWIQIGIVSHGLTFSCSEENMGFYTSLPKVMEWIKEKIPDLEYE